MMIRGSAAGLFIGGIFLWMMAQFIPLLRLMMMDWVAVFMMTGAMVMIFFCFSISGTGLQYDSIPVGTAIINYIRRDGIIVPLLGRRIFSGESFLDVPKLGLVEDLGKDTVFLWGRKKVRFGLENISFTPNPYYNNWCSEMYNLGIDDMDELYGLLNLDKINYDTMEGKSAKVHYLELMGMVYEKMMNAPPRGVDRLTLFFKLKNRANIVFGKRRHKKVDVAPLIKEEKKQISKPPENKVTSTSHKEVEEWLNSRK